MKHQENVSTQRIQNAEKTTLDDLKNIIQSNEPEKYNSMLFESDLFRLNYFLINFSAITFTRSVLVLKFPMYQDIAYDFKNQCTGKNFDSHAIKLANDNLISRIISGHKINPHFHPSLNTNLAFAELPIEMNGKNVLDNQPFYFLTNETDFHTCHNCEGDKYVPCPERECGGRPEYDCPKCHAQGEWTCRKCSGQGRIECSKCPGTGMTKCWNCGGKGYSNFKGGNRGNSWNGPCKVCNGRGQATCDKCKGSGKIKCETCKGKGIETCDYCNGRRQIICKSCYGDYIDNRYGKVDCKNCDATGELGTLVYVDTSISHCSLETCLCDKGNNITGIDDVVKKKLKSDKRIQSQSSSASVIGQIKHFALEAKDVINDMKDSVNSIVGTGNVRDSLEYKFLYDYFQDTVTQPITKVLVYQSINNENYDSYDSFNKVLCEKIESSKNISKTSYPKILMEEVFYEAIPCFTATYIHVLSNTRHQVSLIAADQQKLVLFHSEPNTVTRNSDAVTSSLLKVAVDYWGKAFSTQKYWSKVDKNNEIILMIHVAKADGVVEDQEKQYLANRISHLDEFTIKEKETFFNLMQARELPKLQLKDTLFSTSEKRKEVLENLNKLIGKADGKLEQSEIDKINEISKLMEESKRLKKGKLSAFFTTWQISVPFVFLALVITFLSVYFFIFS